MAVSDFDVTRRFVRVLGELPGGLIEFEFAVGDPDVSVELVMPRPAFEQFCLANGAVLLGAEAAGDPQAADADFKWSLQQATHQRFRT